MISINGTDVDELTHEQVVQLIRNTRGTLTLIVKPNGEFIEEECFFTFELKKKRKCRIFLAKKLSLNVQFLKSCYL